jgi:hypothetical protein
MSSRNSKPTKSSWASLLQSELQREAKSPEGSGWKMFEELLGEHQMGPVKLRRLLSGLLKRGAIEVFEGTRLTDAGTLVKAVWYREVTS